MLTVNYYCIIADAYKLTYVYILKDIYSLILRCYIFQLMQWLYAIRFVLMIHLKYSIFVCVKCFGACCWWFWSRELDGNQLLQFFRRLGFILNIEWNLDKVALRAPVCVILVVDSIALRKDDYRQIDDR